MPNKPPIFKTFLDIQKYLETEWAQGSAADRTFTANGTVANALTANNALHLGGKVEGQLSVLAAASATSALQLGGKLEAALDVNSAAWLTNAAHIVNGTVPTARLGSGTANSSTFLAGDQTWKSVAAFVPLANTTVNGAVSTTTQSFAGDKTFTANVLAAVLIANGASAAVYARDRSTPSAAMAMYADSNEGNLWHSDYSGGITARYSNTANWTFANSVTVTTTMQAKTFRSATNTVSCLTATATTVYALTSGDKAWYQVFARIATLSNDAANYTVVGDVLQDGTSARLARANNAGLMTLSLSGLNIQVTQSSGGTQSVDVTVVRVA